MESRTGTLGLDKILGLNSGVPRWVTGILRWATGGLPGYFPSPLVPNIFNIYPIIFLARLNYAGSVQGPQKLVAQHGMPEFKSRILRSSGVTVQLSICNQEKECCDDVTNSCARDLIVATYRYRTR